MGKKKGPSRATADDLDTMWDALQAEIVPQVTNRVKSGNRGTRSPPFGSGAYAPDIWVAVHTTRGLRHATCACMQRMVHRCRARPKR
jgi:hypothetical protein